LDAASSALSTQKYVFHIAVGGAASGIDRMAATSPPCTSPDRSKMDEPLVSARAMKYLSSELGGITSSNSQSKRPP
jgi:hypothetical protein